MHFYYLLLYATFLLMCYSINNDWSFDDEISDAFGCQVFAFDPSMNIGERVETTLRTRAES